MNVRAAPTVPLLDLDNLRTLVAIAETGSFSGAATAVFRTPSAISMQVKKMEDLLGRPLFLRDSRSVELTGDGEFLLTHARRMLALNREAMARFVAPDMSGVVRMGATEDVSAEVLPEMLRRFAASHAGVTVDVVVEASRRMVEMVADRRLDLALVNSEIVGEGASEVVFREPLVWAMASCGVAVEREPLPLSVWDETCSWRQAAVTALDAAGRDWRLVFKSGHTQGQKAAVMADFAVAPLPRSALGPGIVEVPACHRLPALPDYGVGLIMAEDAAPPVLAAADHLRAAFARV